LRSRVVGTGGVTAIEDVALPLLHVVILAVVQGITEFLPISSSGHLDVVWKLFDWAGWAVPENTSSDRQIVNIAAHVGTLLAVCLYFWRDLAQIAAGLAKLLAGQMNPGARLAFYIVLGSLPILIVGYFFREQITGLQDNIRVIAWATIGFGVLLLIADRTGLTVRRVEHLGAAGALFIGLAQVFAFIPGTSRSGITMTAARFLGFERAEAARFSLLLSIPAILGAGTLTGLDLYESGNMRLGFDAIAAAAISSVVAFLAIALMLRWLRAAGFLPFVFYRLILGAALLIWIA
jgi:undecaprenyl-diphosphatase